MAKPIRILSRSEKEIPITTHERGLCRASKIQITSLAERIWIIVDTEREIQFAPKTQPIRIFSRVRKQTWSSFKTQQARGFSRSYRASEDFSRSGQANVS
ncbi:myelin-associated glycoprotein [Platysternon megacephalum]|uniref:Myelin-associated glycoprotein n=1 Tax=Platysternon megacephalum TaxID=55544 RepID=A0A4D9DSU5_9SAUR|nr:myelin-associated glycoprotein [Platysternon megacephalum]